MQVVLVAASYVVEQTGADTAAGAKTNTVASVTIPNMATRRHRSTFISQPSAVSVGSAQVKTSPVSDCDEIHGAASEAAVADLADVPRQPHGLSRFDRFILVPTAKFAVLFVFIVLDDLGGKAMAFVRNFSHVPRLLG